MGRWGTCVVSAKAPTSGELDEEVQLAHGWRQWLLPTPLSAPRDMAEIVRRGAAIVATVADSDWCALVGVDDGAIAWEWSFGSAPWEQGPVRRGEPAPLSAADVATRVQVWAAGAGLAPVGDAEIAAVLDQGYVFAEDGLQALLRALGLASRPSDADYAAAEARPIRIWRSPNRWTLLQCNTTADLFEHLDAVIAWLRTARQEFVEPLISSFAPGVVRMSIDPHESIAGAPGGLLVSTGGWSMKNRPVFGAGDAAGWERKLRQLSRRELREVSLRATAFGPTGRTYGGPGEMDITVVLRDQFTRDASAPLPGGHPGQLKAWASVKLLDRLPGFTPVAALQRLGELALDSIPDAHAFVEPDRPLSGDQEVVPVSPLAWSAPPGAVAFRPESVVYLDPSMPN